MNRGWILLFACIAQFSVAGFAYAQQSTTGTTPSNAATTSTQSPAIPADVNPSIGKTLSGDGNISTNITQQRQGGTYESARVISVKTETEGNESGKIQKQIYSIEIRSGSLKGKTVTLNSELESNPYRLQPKTGDKIIVFIQQSETDEPNFYLEGYDRRIPLLWLFILFTLTLALLSGWQGIKVVLSILISIGLIGWILIPAFIKGFNPVPIAITLSGIFTLIASGLSFGWNKKTLATTFGTIGGAVIALIISALFASWAHLNGLGSEEDRLFFAQNSTLDPRGLLFAGIIIAAMGVVEDVAVSIASGIEQVARANPNTSFKNLFTAGMIVGKDHMAAMANTIIFAYVGASLSTLLLFSQYDSNWIKFLNFDSVTEEIVRSLAATIGLIFTVPITALLATWFIHTKQVKKKTLIHTVSSK